VDERERVDPSRLPSIDILRGFAIAWVILFHLWGDLEFFPGVPRVYYEQLTDQVREGAGIWPVFTAFGELFFRDGFQGVPLFMMISGISLTIAACRGSGAPGEAFRWPKFFAQRFRKLLVPYWAGVAITYGVIALIAWRQVALDGGSFADQFTGGVTISRGSTINIDWSVVTASVALLPRLLDAKWFFAPQLALWFVGLLAQYYLLFPLLFFAMKRLGVVPFVVVTFAITVASNVWIVDRYGAPEFQFWLVTGWAPFRLFEFTFGMAIGWLLASPDRARAVAMLRHPLGTVLLLVAGFAAHTAGDLLIGQWTARYWQAMALPLVTLGLGLIVLPLLVKRPSRFEAAAPVRAFAAFGVMSYALLIVNDPMRLVASQLRLEDVSQLYWWTFLVAIYVPASVALAWPLAHLLGLMPKRRPAPPAAPVPPQARDREEALAAAPG
jgi:peptidoglycan/LPS O-acetylase OafA/YrhL